MLGPSFLVLFFSSYGVLTNHSPITSLLASQILSCLAIHSFLLLLFLLLHPIPFFAGRVVFHTSSLVRSLLERTGQP